MELQSGATTDASVVTLRGCSFVEGSFIREDIRNQGDEFRASLLLSVFTIVYFPRMFRFWQSSLEGHYP